MTCFTSSTSTAYCSTERQLRSVCTTTFATLRCTNTSPGARPTIWFAGTRLSEQPIQRYSGACRSARSAKNGGRLRPSPPPRRGCARRVGELGHGQRLSARRSAACAQASCRVRRAGGHASATPATANDATDEARTSFNIDPFLSSPPKAPKPGEAAAVRDISLMKISLASRCQCPDESGRSGSGAECVGYPGRVRRSRSSRPMAKEMPSYRVLIAALAAAGSGYAVVRQGRMMMDQGISVEDGGGGRRS